MTAYKRLGSRHSPPISLAIQGPCVKRIFHVVFESTIQVLKPIGALMAAESVTDFTGMAQNLNSKVRSPDRNNVSPYPTEDNLAPAIMW